MGCLTLHYPAGWYIIYNLFISLKDCEQRELFSQDPKILYALKKLNDFPEIKHFIKNNCNKGTFY